MPIITGPISRDGAVIDVFVGVPNARRHALVHGSILIPTPITVRAVIDTGAAITGFSPSLFGRLGLTAVDSITVRPPVGPPQPTDRYKVSLYFVADGTQHLFAEAPVIAADGFEPSEEIQGIIGRDVLDHCSFQYWGTAREFQFAF